jgi:hypothetical protein
LSGRWLLDQLNNNIVSLVYWDGPTHNFFHSELYSDITGLCKQCDTNIFDYSNIRRLISYIRIRIFFLIQYEYIWYSYLVKLTWRIYIWCIFGMDLVDIWHIFGIYSNKRHQISIIWIRIFYFIGTNIFGICIRSKYKLWIYSYSVQNLIFVLHCVKINEWALMSVYINHKIIKNETSTHDWFSTWQICGYLYPRQVDPSGSIATPPSFVLLRMTISNSASMLRKLTTRLIQLSTCLRMDFLLHVETRIQHGNFNTKGSLWST